MTTSSKPTITRMLVMWNMVTLDGYFEGSKQWEIDWHDYAWGEELERFAIEQSKSIGTLLFGRVTYEGMASYWPTAKGEIADFMNSIPKIVFSRTLQKAEWNNTQLVRDHAEEEVVKLKQQRGKDLYIFGSANLSATLAQRGLIIGKGQRLFAEGAKPQGLKFVDSKTSTTGVIIATYEPSGELKTGSFALEKPTEAEIARRKRLADEK